MEVMAIKFGSIKAAERSLEFDLNQKELHVKVTTTNMLNVMLASMSVMYGLKPNFLNRHVSEEEPMVPPDTAFG